MKNAQRLFAEITAMLEDLHGLAVEGQRRDNTLDISLMLASGLRKGLPRIERATATIIQQAARR